MTETSIPADPAFITFEMPEKSPMAGTFGCFETTLALCAAMHRSTLLAEAISHCDGYDRGHRASHWRGVKKSDLARFVASMNDGAPITLGEALQYRRENKELGL